MKDITSQFIQKKDADISIGFFSEEQRLPVVVTARNANVDAIAWSKDHRELIECLRDKYGAVLFRGFDVPSTEVFESFVEATSAKPASNYVERQLKRDAVDGNVFTSTIHPKQGEIFLHNEQSFNLAFPGTIYFSCRTAASKGGCTPLADVRKVYQRIPEDIRNKFIEKHYMYVRNFMKHMYVNWEWAFQSKDKKEVEDYCREHDMSCAWSSDNGEIELTTKQLRPVAFVHPRTGENCWFNHCLAFNNALLEPAIQKLITDSFSVHEYPNHTFYGDGDEIEDEVIEILRRAYKDEEVTFQWQEGDVVLIDNMLVAHGRQPYEGDRLVWLAMSEMRDLNSITRCSSTNYAADIELASQ